MTCARLVAACVAVVMAAALSACGGLATESAVQQGSPVGEAAVPPVRVQPDGPTRGATPEQIVRGFIKAGAGAGFDDDHAVARSFFTADVKDEWLPDSGVEVYGDESALKIELVRPTSVRVTASIVARIDGLGRFHETPAGTSAQATFAMEKLDVGWRISAPQKRFGLWLSVSDLDLVYRPFTIAYASTTAPEIVGDPRWFPISSGLATLLARAQLAPAPAYLSGAVKTGVPSGTALAVDAVPVQSGRAVVDLKARALSADPEMRRAMWAQFVATLTTQVPSVSQVSLQVEGAGLDLPGAPDIVSSLADLGYQVDSSDSAKTAVLRLGSELSRVPSDRPPDQDPPRKPAKPAPTSALPTVPTGWVSLALSWNGEEIAGIGGDHADLARWQGTRMFQLPKFGSQLTKPSYDSLNGLWVAGRAGDVSKVWVINTSVPPAKAARREISAPWLAQRKVVALRVASDNQRLALITTDLAGGDEQVAVAGIVRNAKGTPVSLAAEPLRVGWTLTAATDLAWVDERTLVVVGRARPKDALGPLLVQIGGKVTALSPVAGARLVTSTGGLRGIVVTTDRGTVLARAGKGWQELQKGSDFLIPGR